MNPITGQVVPTLGLGTDEQARPGASLRIDRRN